MGGLIGAVASIALIVFLVQLARKRNAGPPTNANLVQVDITTAPAGASIRINNNNDAHCPTAPCRLTLSPGNYQVTAFLDGYEPAASGVTVAPGSAIPVSLILESQAQTVRILTDLDFGKVTFDGQPPVDLQEGQFIVDKVKDGSHTVKVVGRSGEATFTFDTGVGKAPVVTGPLKSTNLIAVAVSSLGNRAHLTTSSSSPVKVSLNGQPQGEAGPGGLDLTGFAPGVQELVMGEGKDQRNMKENFNPAPMLTVFLKSDLNVGTLIVSTGDQDNATVFLNGKEYRRKTQRGQVRIQTLGAVTVKVAKDGFQPEQEQRAEIKKGEEVRLEFKLKPLPQIGALQIKGGVPDTQVFIDQRNVGRIAADGSLSAGNIAPGDHAIELRKDQFGTKRIQRQFKPGETVLLTGGDVVMTASVATVHLTRSPAESTVTYKKSDDPQTHEVRGDRVELQPGSYVFTARANGYPDHAESFQIAAGETRSIDLRLSRERAASPPTPTARVGTIADFADAAGWQKEGDSYAHKGGGFVGYKITPTRGTFSFIVQLVKGGGVFRGAKIRWYLNFKDTKNHALFELDKKNFVSKDVVNGKSTDREKTAHEEDKDMSYAIQIDVTPERVVHKLKSGDQWIVIGSWNQPGRNFTDGQFGFYIPGNDEIAVMEFKFTPK